MTIVQIRIFLKRYEKFKGNAPVNVWPQGGDSHILRVST